MILRDQIFVQIAAYRDPELIPTIKDCLEKAKYPSRINFAIAWQHSSEDEWDNLEEFKNNQRFQILDIDYKKTFGVCWARSELQKLWNGEKYTLQLDSHHRFEQDWDETLIGMVENLREKGHKKPLLTAYLPSYEPKDYPKSRLNSPWRIEFDRFSGEGVLHVVPEEVKNHEEFTEPIPARFGSGHFVFTYGIVNKMVPYDPHYYFYGEEISFAVRAFTHGFDLFHPHIPVVWHQYTRRGEKRHWDDHENWSERDKASFRRNQKLFGMDGFEYDPKEFGFYGFGRIRTLEDYEKYAGVSFKKRAVQQETLDRKLPPNPSYENEEDYEKSFIGVFKECINVHFDVVPLDDYDFWAVAFEDENGVELHRQDADAEEIKRMKTDPDRFCRLWRSFHTEVRPYTWIVWPHSKSKGWQERLTGALYEKS